MKIKKLVAFIAISTSITMASVAAELPECKFESGLLPVFNAQTSALSDASTVMDVRGDLKNGQTISYGKNAAILVVDLTVTRISPAFVPNADLKLKSSWLMSSDYRFAAGREILFSGEAKTQDGKMVRWVHLNNNGGLLVTEEGKFCNKALNLSTNPPVWAAGTLTQEPADVQLDMKLVERPSKPTSMRVIFNGTNAGQISFQEVWVNGNTVIYTKAKNFDQFAKEVTIGPFQFDVVAVDGDQIKIQYDIPARSKLTGEQLRSIH